MRTLRAFLAAAIAEARSARRLVRTWFVAALVVIVGLGAYAHGTAMHLDLWAEFG